ncbi:RING-like zinc finger [Fragilaria crotonensis]|nr:RING-like zinc finger [Fragilaria crotonensis]
MMRQATLRGFLAGSLLVSVASARGCSVCGDGYHVGSPSAIPKVRFPEQVGNQYTCSDLEFAGLEGLIPSEECSALSSLIFETCDCQENTESTEKRSTHSRNAIDLNVAKTGNGTTRTSFGGTVSRRRQAGRRRRRRTTSGRSLKYDSQSKQYVFYEDPAEATTCSICMEFLVPEDDTVTSLCTHVYHRECIMNWLQCDHDECPNCRQPMWDPETYMVVDQQIMDQNSGSPSTRSAMLSP